MKKTNYSTPTIGVIEVLYAQTICTSGGDENQSTVGATRDGSYGNAQKSIWD